MPRLLALAVFFSSILTARTDSLLILPFANLSKDPNLDWIGESISETIREVLSSEGVLVLDRASRQEAYRRLTLRPYASLTRASVIHLAQALDAGRVVYGEFQLTPVDNSAANSRGSLRIGASVLDVRGMARGPQFDEIGPIEDLAALQTRVAWRALQYASPDSALSLDDFQNRRTPARVEAIENYIRGLLAVSPEQKYAFFSQAAKLDPAYSPPSFQIGRLHWDKQQYKEAADWFERVNQQDSHFREARFYLGLCRYYLRDYAAAEKAFQLVAQTVPLNEVLNNLGAAQVHRSAGAALDNFQKALDGDSTDPDYHFNVGYAFWMLEHYEQAADHFRATLDRDPEDAEAILMLGRCLKKTRPPADPKTGGLQRLKHEYQETAFRQLKAVLERPK